MLLYLYADGLLGVPLQLSHTHRHTEINAIIHKSGILPKLASLSGTFLPLLKSETEIPTSSVRIDHALTYLLYNVLPHTEHVASENLGLRSSARLQERTNRTHEKRG